MKTNRFIWLAALMASYTTAAFATPVIALPGTDINYTGTVTATACTFSVNSGIWTTVPLGRINTSTIPTIGDSTPWAPAITVVVTGCDTTSLILTSMTISGGMGEDGIVPMAYGTKNFVNLGAQLSLNYGGKREILSSSKGVVVDATAQARSLAIEVRLLHTAQAASNGAVYIPGSESAGKTIVTDGAITGYHAVYFEYK